MILGKRSFFEKEHLKQKSGYAPPYLCELVVYCLELVSQLSYYNLRFRFKGGNSLLILLENPQRFSIDVDIVTTESKEKLINVVEKIGNSCELFTKLEIRQHKTKPWLPMLSFNIFFNSFYKKEKDAFIMLDAIFEESPYEGVFKQIKCQNIYKSEQIVEVPTISALIADKILTLGPSTLGIPLDKNKEAQRLKHLFDVALLAREDIDYKKISFNLINGIEQENRLQRSKWTIDEIFEDTIKFCSLPLKYDKIPDLNSLEQRTYLYEIVKGFDEFKSHIFGIRYTWDLFKKDCKTVMELVDRIKEAK